MAVRQLQEWVQREMGAAGTGPTGMGTALGFTPLFTRVERLSAGLTLNCFTLSNSTIFTDGSLINPED